MIAGILVKTNRITVKIAFVDFNKNYLAPR